MSQPEVGEPEADIVVQEESFKTLIKPASAEFVGSIFFLFIAVGMAVSTTDFINPGNVQTGISLTFGFTIFVLAFTIGHLSGGHLNPAVTLGFVVVKKITPLRAIMYFGAQLSGMIIGVALMYMWTPPRFHLNCIGANQLGTSVNTGMAFGVEFVLTFFLLFVVSAASDSSKSNTTLVPFAIGHAVTVAHFMSIAMTGTSINPTRSFASAVVAAAAGCSQPIWGPHWLFWVAPLLGGVSGALTYQFAFIKDFGFSNTLLSMYRKQPPMPQYFDRFKQQRQAVAAEQSATDETNLA